MQHSGTISSLAENLNLNLNCKIGKVVAISRRDLALNLSLGVYLLLVEAGPRGEP